VAAEEMQALGALSNARDQLNCYKPFGYKQHCLLATLFHQTATEQAAQHV